MNIQAFHQTPGDNLSPPPQPPPYGFDSDLIESPFHVTSCTESLGTESSEEMTSSRISRSSSSSSSGVYRRRENKWMTEKTFPPPLTSLSENGRRNFTLKSMRENGRLEITGVMIERPEILCASRRNGRLRLHLVQTSVPNDEDSDSEAVEEEDDGGEEAETETEAEEEEERDRWMVVTTAASRRCFHMRETQVWGQQHRYVTTM